MSGHQHGVLRVRFYPGHGEWTCVVQRMGADGMPMGPDEVSATGPTREDARTHAIEAATDEEIREALRRAH
jgi:hypothetical protein